MPFLGLGLVGPQQVVEELPLPDLSLQLQGATKGMGGPRLPWSHRPAQRHGPVADRRDEEMNVIRHDHIAADTPAAPRVHYAPLVQNDPMRDGISEQRPASECADRDEVDRVLRPDMVQAGQVPLAFHVGHYGESASSRQGCGYHDQG